MPGALNEHAKSTNPHTLKGPPVKVLSVFKGVLGRAWNLTDQEELLPCTGRMRPKASLVREIIACPVSLAVHQLFGNECDMNGQTMLHRGRIRISVAMCLARHKRLHMCMAICRAGWTLDKMSPREGTSLHFTALHFTSDLNDSIWRFGRRPHSPLMRVPQQEHI